MVGSKGVRGAELWRFEGFMNRTPQIGREHTHETIITALDGNTRVILHAS